MHASALRSAFDRPGHAERVDWRAVAKRTGVVRVWKDGTRERVALEFWIGGKRRMIYADVSRWGDREPLTRESAEHLLGLIRAQIETKRSIEEALAPFLGATAPENLIGARWARFLEQKEREARDGRITARHLREIRGVERRGYLAPLLERSIYELDFGLLEDWLGWLAEAKPNLSPKTRRHALGQVMSFAHWLRRRREIREVPEAPEIRVPEHSPVLLDDATRARILEAIPEDARGAFLAMAHLALRPGEARGIDARAYRDGFIVVDQAAKDRLADGELGPTKTRMVRRLPCAPELAAWIEKHVSKRARLEGGPMFVNPRGHTKGKRWSGSALERTWRRACLTAFGRAFPMYEGTRHSWASLALNDGEPKHVVRAVLGHTSERMTDFYAKLQDTAMVSAIHRQRRTVSKPSPGTGGTS